MLTRPQFEMAVRLKVGKITPLQGKENGINDENHFYETKSKEKQESFWQEGAARVKLVLVILFQNKEMIYLCISAGMY